MLAILSLLLVLTMSLLVTRIATTALALTGLSRQTARFQARSAFTGVGFTTTESERVVAHPLRRRILMILMLLGNAGVVTAVASLLVAFLGAGEDAPGWMRFALLAGGLAALWFASASRAVDRWLSRLITWALERWTDLDVRDYAGLLHLGGDYTVSEFFVDANETWITGRTLADLGLREEGVLCLAVERRDGTFLGAPQADTTIEVGDMLLLYGRSEAVADLADRHRGFGGWERHREAIDRHDAVVESEERADADRHAEER
jgi:hypothetical protein